MRWKVASACVRGSAHVRSGLPNQDAAQCVVTPGGGPAGTDTSVAVVAVSDGHGGARHFRSQIGSTLAVSTAVTLLQQFLPAYAGAGATALEAGSVQTLQRNLVENWTALIASDLEHHPFDEDELDALEEAEGPESRSSVEATPLLAYGATLLVAAATDGLLLYMQLGDGEILSVAANGETVRPLPPDDRLVGNQTTSLCQPDAWNDFRAGWVTESALPALVLISTDGYANSFRSDEDFLKIGQDYLAIIREQGISLLAEELPQILTEATQQGSGDDITLAILQGELRQGNPDAISGPVKPKLSPESRSKLIDQLKARHSSQQHRLEELSSRVEKAHKDNRRLQALIVLLILLVIGVGVFFFRDRIFPQSVGPEPVKKPQTIAPATKTPESAPETAPTTPAVASASEWTLELDGIGKLTLTKGVVLKRKQFFHADDSGPRGGPGGGDDPYAEVAWQKVKMVLINRSNDEWWWKPQGGGHATRIVNGGQITLGKEPITVTFAGVTGKISPQSPAPAAAEPAPAGGSRPKLD